MITFDSQSDFESAVMEVLRKRLDIKLTVNQVSDGDFYNPKLVPEVEIELVDSALDIEPICQAEARAW